MVGVGRILNRVSITYLQETLLIELVRTHNTHSLFYFILFLNLVLYLRRGRHSLKPP